MARKVKAHPAGFDGKAFDMLCKKHDDKLLRRCVGTADPTAGQVADAIESWLDGMVTFPPGTLLAEGDPFWDSYREHLKAVHEACCRLAESGSRDADAASKIALSLLHYRTTPDKLAALRRCAERLRAGGDNGKPQPRSRMKREVSDSDAKRGKVGEEKWRRAKEELLERLDQNKLPTNITIKDTAKLIGHTYATTQSAISKSPRLQQHLNLGGGNEGPQDDAVTSSDILNDLSGVLQRQFQMLPEDQQDAIEKQLRKGGKDQTDAIKALKILATNPEPKSYASVSLDQPGMEVTTNKTIIKSHRKTKPVNVWDQENE